ncbi:MAG: FkbM family methyltransferase [Planctomycetota bacterium]
MNQQLRLLARAMKYRYKLDPAEVGFVRASLQPGMTAIDLGAHKGAYTYWLARGVGPSGRVVAVEPQQSLAERLKAVMGTKAQVDVRWAAISTGTGTGTLSLRPDGSSHGASIAGFPDGQVGRTVEVPTISLDDLAEAYSLERVDFIKCDIEGHEGAVFAAGMGFIRRFGPTIMTECEERHAQGEHGGVTGLAHLFEPEGYRIRFFKDGRLHPLSDFDAQVHQNYCVGEYCNNFVLDRPS